MLEKEPMSMKRRSFLAVAGAGLLPLPPGLGAQDAPKPHKEPLKLGVVTYNIAREWDVPAIIKNLTETKVEAVELRTTHAHKVEVNLSAEARKEVRKRFEDSPVKLASLGSAFEFQSSDPIELRRNIDGAKEYAKLAADVGAKGMKVRPNGFTAGNKGVSEEATLRQIGQSLAEVAAVAGEHGIEIRVEVHGQGTCRLPNIRRMLDIAAHRNVYVCWNSNQEDLLDGGLEANFKLVADRIHFVHMRDLFLAEYPFRHLLALLRNADYSGYCCAEIPESSDPIRVLKYYRALFLALQDGM